MFKPNIFWHNKFGGYASPWLRVRGKMIKVLTKE